MARQPLSIGSRKLDLLYLFFFVIHVPIMLMVDLAPYYPVSIRPQFTVDLRNWYIATYRDRFFVQTPLWFHAFMALEVVYHLPLSLWAIGALLRDDPMVPVHLLVWAVETGMSTLVCCVDAASWEGYSRQELVALSQLYVPYLVFACILGLDMFFRLARTVQHGIKSKPE